MTELFDVYAWATEVGEVKNNVSAELFLFSKNYTPFKIRYSESLTGAIKTLFMQDAVNFVTEESLKGLEYREYEKSDGEDNIIYLTILPKVGRAETLIHLIENEYKDIDYFSEKEQDFKKMKGIIARFTYPGEDGQKAFYIAKALPASSALRGSGNWEIKGESFEPFSAEIAIKIPEDNQVAIVGENIIVFNQKKFEALFQYDYKSQVLAEAKAKELTEKYKLSFSEGLTLDSLLADKKPLLKKVQAMTIEEEMPQDKLLDYADDMQLELMTDDDGSIIIMDDKDLTMFVNLLNEDYYVSPVNGRRYEIKSNKLLSEPEVEPPRG